MFEHESEVTSPPVKRVGIMWDTESLGLPHNSIVYDLAFVAFDLDDPETIIRDVNEHLPLAPQELMDRRVGVSYLPFFARLPASSQATIIDNIPGDLDELLAMIRSVNRKYQMVSDGVYVENWFARPQHDIPLIESLFRNCGEKLPWAYDTVNDLRTLMNQAGMSARDPQVKALGSDLVLHTARGDCLYQIRCYAAAQVKLRSSV